MNQSEEGSQPGNDVCSSPPPILPDPWSSTSTLYLSGSIAQTEWLGTLVNYPPLSYNAGLIGDFQRWHLGYHKFPFSYKRTWMAVGNQDLVPQMNQNYQNVWLVNFEYG